MLASPTSLTSPLGWAFSCDIAFHETRDHRDMDLLSCINAFPHITRLLYYDDFSRYTTRYQQHCIQRRKQRWILCIRPTGLHRGRDYAHRIATIWSGEFSCGEHTPFGQETYCDALVGETRQAHAEKGAERPATVSLAIVPIVCQKSPTLMSFPVEVLACTQIWSRLSMLGTSKEQANVTACHTSRVLGRTQISMH